MGVVSVVIMKLNSGCGIHECNYYLSLETMMSSEEWRRPEKRQAIVRKM